MKTLAGASQTTECDFTGTLTVFLGLVFNWNGEFGLNVSL